MIAKAAKGCTPKAAKGCHLYLWLCNAMKSKSAKNAESTGEYGGNSTVNNTPTKRRPAFAPDHEADHAAAVAWAKDVMADPATIFVDTETTGLDFMTVELCDISIVAANGVILLDTLVRPDKPIPLQASGIHGITNEMVQDAPTFEDIAADLDYLLSDSCVVIYNAEYDAKVINSLCRRHQLPPIAGDWQCAMRWHAAYIGDHNQWDSGYDWHNLARACRGFGITPGGHRALADTLATLEVVKAMAADRRAWAPRNSE